MPAGTAPGISTFDVTPQPYRPGGADFNGAALIDDTANPPDPSTMPTGPLLNTISLLLVSIGKVVANAILTVVGGVSPVITAVMAVKSGVTTGTFTIVRNSAGDYSITWPANTFPATQASPTATLNIVGGLVATHAYSISAENIANGVRVTTILDAVKTDLNFTVEVR